MDGEYVSLAESIWREQEFFPETMITKAEWYLEIPDRVKVIRDTHNELMSMIVRRSIAREVLCPDGRYRIESVYVEPLEAGVPRELFSHLKELCDICKKYISPNNTPVEEGNRRQPFSIRCRTRSLCAAVLWERVRFLRFSMSISEFSERCGVSVDLVTNVSKHLDNK